MSNTSQKPKIGPPFKPESERRVQRSIRLLPRHWAKIDAAGKAEFEKLIERWEVKTHPPGKP